MSGRELLHGIKSDSPSVWKQLFSSPATTMRKLFQPKMQQVRDVTFDDVFAEACTILMQHVKEGRLDESAAKGELNLEGYLYKICENLVRKYTRRKASVSMDDPHLRICELGGSPKDDPMVGSLLGGDLESEDSKEMEEFFDRVLVQMKEDQRKILKLFYWEKMSMAEIAVVCGYKNEDVAKTVKNRCMAKFKKLAHELLSNDEKLEEALARTVERAALRNQINECRLIGSRTLAFSAMNERSAEAPADFAPMHSCGEHADFAPMPKLKPSAEAQLLAAIKENSPAAWRQLYDQLFNSFQQDFSPKM